MSVDAPRWSNLRHPRESLKNLIGGAGHHWKSILATATIAAGVAGVVEVAKIISESQLPNRPNLQQDEEKQPGGVMPSAIAFNEGVVATRVPESTATATSVPRVEPTKAPPVQAAEILPIAEVPNHLDTLSASVNTLSKPYWNDTVFEERKKDIVKTIEVIKKDLKDNKVADARTKLAGNDFNLLNRILELGDTSKAELREVEIKAKYDPENRFSLYPHLVDPRIKENLYVPVMEVYADIYSAK